MKIEKRYLRPVEMQVGEVITEALERLVKSGWELIAPNSWNFTIIEGQLQSPFLPEDIAEEDIEKKLLTKYFTIEKDGKQFYLQGGSFPLFEGLSVSVKCEGYGKHANVTQQIASINYRMDDFENSVQNVLDYFNKKA